MIARNKRLAAAATSLLQQRRRFDSVDQLRKSEAGRINYERILDNLHVLKQFYKHYDVISLIDGANGEVVISTYPAIVGKTLSSFSSYIDTLGKKDVAVKDIHTSELTDQNCMTYFCPVCMTDTITMESSDYLNLAQVQDSGNQFRHSCGFWFVTRTQRFGLLISPSLARSVITQINSQVQVVNLNPPQKIMVSNLYRLRTLSI